MRVPDLVREVREHQRAARFERRALAAEVAVTLFGSKEDGEAPPVGELDEEATLAIAQQMIQNARETDGAS